MLKEVHLKKDLNLVLTSRPFHLTLSKNPVKKTGPNLKSHPDCIEGIKFGGFNVVTLANNHIMDYGQKGLRDTINICSKNYQYAKFL